VNEPIRKGQDRLQHNCVIFFNDSFNGDEQGIASWRNVFEVLEIAARPYW
jgi:hypothetical protein